ncbi:integrase [Gossypium australe]|uniref:Integrase n=1 Tax=Gossypium australe TaxID=47621 RepID=A0A5B6X186_9ROSI|nr:integrase [Gossypium australe]
MLKDYDLFISYHSGKANVVVDVVSKKSLFALRALNILLTLNNDEFSVDADGILYFHKRLYVPNNLELKQDILFEACSSTYSIHPGSIEMFFYLT